jgi:hypothetical protein
MFMTAIDRGSGRGLPQDGTAGGAGRYGRYGRYGRSCSPTRSATRRG